MNFSGKHALTLFAKRTCHYFLVASTLLATCLFASPTQQLNETNIVATLTKHYGQRAGLRTKAWFKVLNDANGLPELEQLERVNKFFNMFRFVDDKVLWGDSNYWASPMEFIGVNGGDCEDFSIAKYFTLLQLGVSEDKLRITMVKATTLNQYHMVLAYYQTPSSIPLVLDNLD